MSNTPSIANAVKKIARAAQAGTGCRLSIADVKALAQFTGDVTPSKGSTLDRKAAAQRHKDRS